MFRYTFVTIRLHCHLPGERDSPATIPAEGVKCGSCSRTLEFPRRYIIEKIIAAKAQNHAPPSLQPSASPLIPEGYLGK
jgi:hypothetical protein